MHKHGNFPYDFDSKFPDPRPLPIPRNPFPSPPPAVPPPVETIPDLVTPAPAESAAPPAASEPPHADPEVPSISQPTPAADPAPQPPQTPAVRYHMGVPRPLRRIGPLNPHSAAGLPPQEEPEPARHDRKCSICNHPYREAIEEDFVNWIRPYSIAREFGLTERSIFRHARATGLCDLRGRKLLSAADLLIECAGEATVTGDTVLRAIRTRTRLNSSGEWVEPPKRVIYSIEHLSAPATAPPPPVPALTDHTENPVLELAQQSTADSVLIVSQEPLENDVSR